jgi:cytochrome c5
MKTIITFLMTAFISPLSAQMLLPENTLPEYEQDIDHAKLIKRTDKKTIQQGRKIYDNVCMNCHGNIKQIGSIPTSLRFAQGQFQHGSDPHTMYQTLTRGWRAMPPQPQLTPREKYAVIHYIRDQYLKKHNPSQLFKVTAEYLAKLPTGTSLGPEPPSNDAPDPWTAMNYGDFLINTYEIATEQDRKKAGGGDQIAPDANLAYKGIALRLDPGEGGVSKGKNWSIFEHDSMRVAGVWQGEGFIDWKGVHFDGKHVVRPRTIGTPVLETKDEPGWANPDTGNFDDLRFKGPDGLHYGPLPRKWAHYKGIYKHGSQTIISYSIGNADILESHELATDGAFVRQLNIGKSSKALTLRVAPSSQTLSQSGSTPLKLRNADGYWTITFTPESTPVNIAFTIGGETVAPAKDLTPLTKGGPAQWPETLIAEITRGNQPGAFQWDHFDVPTDTLWNSRLRTSGFDFTPDGKSIIVCCWDGDVWKVDGVSDSESTHTTWKRIASGLFQPLGLKIVNGRIFVTCRDQIVILNDLNGNGETDFYESFNSDAQVTNHFHEFAMGLQADDEGNLYYARSARHARPPLVPHHGTLLKVSADGSQTEILARGFRAANGVCRNADGTFFVTDQEGHWNPMNRINHVTAGNNFYGNMWGYGAPEDSSDAAMEQPLCWVAKKFDRSPAELLWIDSDKWGPFNDKLIHLSYGHGRLSLVPHETIDDKKQGGLIRFPLPDLATGVMRGRFHSGTGGDGQLYTCGMAAWSTSQSKKKGGLFRIRYTGKPAHLPTQLSARQKGVSVTFSEPLDPASITPKALKIKSWDYIRSKNYGSKHLNEKSHSVTATSLSPDGKTLTFQIAELSTCWQMSIKYELQAKDGSPVRGEIQNTIHTLKP